jgi:hypothetical protein
VNDNGDRYHSVTFDYDTQASDMSYYFGDRWAGFIKSSNSWGNDIIRRSNRSALSTKTIKKPSRYGNDRCVR